MTAATCSAVTTPGAVWSFCPSLPANSILTAAFTLTTIVHLVQAIYYKKPYCWVIVASGATQTLCYIFRLVSILNPTSISDYAAWFVLILIAPLFTNAFVYVVMGRMVWNFTPTRKIYHVTAWQFGIYFVLLDIIALIVQLYGAATAATGDVDKTLNALHIYMIGVGIQEGFILLFCFFAARFHLTLRQEINTPFSAKYKPLRILSLLYCLYLVLALITVRIIFRLVEYSQGLGGPLPENEIYQYCLDSLPMLLALITLNIVHPGRIINSKESDNPSRKGRGT